MVLRILYLAGINNSEPQHWQSLWYKNTGGVWVDHADWNHPNASDWLANLKRYLDLVPEPKILMAHSLGCLLAALWAMKNEDSNLLGAFLVAPPDPSGPAFPKTAQGFATPQLFKPAFPTWILASQNDPYSDLEFSKRLAFHWNSRFIDVGEKGHINLKSNLGFWDEGWQYFQKFIGK